MANLLIMLCNLFTPVLTEYGCNGRRRPGEGFLGTGTAASPPTYARGASPTIVVVPFPAEAPLVAAHTQLHSGGHLASYPLVRSVKTRSSKT